MNTHCEWSWLTCEAVVGPCYRGLRLALGALHRAIPSTNNYYISKKKVVDDRDSLFYVVQRPPSAFIGHSMCY